jgi:fumarate reductase flavoprotein subunit
VSINGANRLGSNSLTELLRLWCSGWARAAAFAKAKRRSIPRVGNQAKGRTARIRKNFLAKTDGRERIAAIRTEMTSAMEAGAGVYREEASLRETCNKIAELKERFKNVTLMIAAIPTTRS